MPLFQKVALLFGFLAAVATSPTENFVKFASSKYMVIVAQSVRALDCGSRGRGFEPRLSPKKHEEVPLFNESGTSVLVE